MSKNIFADKKQLILFLKIGVGYLALSLFGALVSHPDQFLQAYLLNETWMAIYVVAVNYIFFVSALPQLSTKRLLFSAWLIARQVFLFSVGMYMWRALGIGLHIFTALKTFKNAGQGIAEQMGDGIGSLIFFTIVRHIYNYLKLRTTARQLQIEKKEAELNYLKSQTNPHFLFNTLNNIYSLARDKSDLAPESILRLSKILRFMLYEAGGNFISIEKELKIITDYIALEKLRYDESLQINFNYDVEDMNQALPPLLLIPLVENAFKHGVSETRHRPFVDIHLSLKSRQLKLVIKNSTENVPGVAVVENIGLSNLRRQLQLLYNDYSLKAEQQNGTFVSVLIINLASHV